MKNSRGVEQYSDTMSRLYPELHKLPEGVTEENYALRHGKDRVFSREVTFQVTDRCSLACTYCYQINKGKRRMSFETAKKFVDLLISGEKGFYDYINKDCSPAIILDFIGGEPFLEVELIDKTCDYFMERCIELHHPWANNFMISICSNGVAYFEPAVQKFLNKWRNRISFSITIDGDKELHDSCRVFPDGSPSYDLAVAAAKDWMSRGYYLGSKITIAPGNIDCLGRALKHMMSLGYDDINCNCVYEDVWEQEHAIKLYRQLKDFIDYLYDNDLEDSIYLSILSQEDMKWQSLDELNIFCGGTSLSMIACDPDGNLYSCLRFMESSLGDQQKAPRVGNLDRGLVQTEEEKCILCDMDTVTRRSYNTDECFYCPIATGCGDCAAYNYQSSGSFHKRATYICEMHKARCLATAYYWGKYYEKHPDKSKGKFKCYMPEDWILKIITQEEYDELKSVSGIEWLPLRWQDVKEILEGKAVVE